MHVVRIVVPGDSEIGKAYFVPVIPRVGDTIYIGGDCERKVTKIVIEARGPEEASDPGDVYVVTE